MSLAQVLDQILALAPDQLGNGLFVQLGEKFAIARQIPAVEQRDGELNVIGIQLFAFGQIARGRTKLQPQVPEFLRETSNRIFEFAFGTVTSAQEQQINVGVREEPAASESASRDQREILRAVRARD